MENRKNPHKDLKKNNGLYFQIGLLIALLFTVSAFEWKTKMVLPDVDFSYKSDYDTFIDPKITEIDPPERPKPKKIITEVTVTDDPTVEINMDEFIVDPTIEMDDPVILPPQTVETADKVVTYADVMPSPKGGYNSFYSFVGREVEYTRQARSIHLQGTVYISFIVDENGELSEIKVAKGIGGGLDEQALEAIKKSPAWNPGRQSGRRVKVRMMIPVKFRLN